MSKVALLSVSAKQGIEAFGRGLQEAGFQLLSTGGTGKTLHGEGLPFEAVDTYTGEEEIMNGRVKTLHPAIHAGILARRHVQEDREIMVQKGYRLIDLVAVNLYPFQDKVNQGVSMEEVLENIDIGGPTLIRGAAKNFKDVIVIVDPGDYDHILQLLHTGHVPLETRLALAHKAFQHVSAYEKNIEEYFSRLKEKVGTYEKILAEPEEEIQKMVQDLQGPTQTQGFPLKLSLQGRKIMDLRYGENPHQKAALYRKEGDLKGLVVNGTLLHGKPLSYNNILDGEAAVQMVLEFKQPACCVVKHNNPCGAAVDHELQNAVQKAFQSDLQSAFGSIVAVNRSLELEQAQYIAREISFLEMLIAPSFQAEAVDLLKERWKHVRLLLTGPMPNEKEEDLEFRTLAGGFLVQEKDTAVLDQASCKVVTRSRPGDQEMKDLFFAWNLVKHVRSNAILLARDQTTVGVGAGQMSRVDAARMALWKAGPKAKGSVLASDALIPFPDTLELASEAGVVAIIQPGGSRRDEEVIQKADALDLAMVYTGMRHFKH